MPFSIDNYLNPYYPSSIVPKIPSKLVQRVLGHHKDLKSKDSSILLYLDILIGSFVSILLIEGVFKHSHVFIQHHSPIIIASYGASAILLFNANTAPLSQPRNIIMGHFLSALVGVILQKLFELSSNGRDHLYIGGALSVGISSVVMSIFNCVHPPSGASALMPLVDEGIREMGWWYLPAHLISSVLMVCVACITNNVLRKYPQYWWTSYKKEVIKDDEEMQEIKKIEPERSNNETIAVKSNDKQLKTSNFGKIEITSHELNIPDELALTFEELDLLHGIRNRLASHHHNKNQSKD